MKIMDYPRTGTPGRAESKQNEDSDCQAVKKVPATQLTASERSVQQILHEGDFKNYIPRLIHTLFEYDPNLRLYYCEFTLNIKMVLINL
jgi:hypothetical protein